MTDRLELLAVVALGFLLDQVLGDPHWLYHPVRISGAYISFLEKGIRKLFGEGEGTLSWRCGTCCSRDRDNGGRIRRDLIHQRQDLPKDPVSGICDPVLSAICGKIPEG